MKQGVLFVFLASWVLSASGCAVILLGAGAAGGYAISKDHVQGDTDRPFARVWDESLSAAHKEGVVNLQDRTHGKIEANVENAVVKITVDQLTDRTVRLIVSARKYGMPSQATAQKLFVKIWDRLE